MTYLKWSGMAVLILAVGTLLLRLGGRKSISQMTIVETVIMISIGTLLIQPVSGKDMTITFVVAAVLIIMLRLFEHLQVKSDIMETLLTGKAIPVIQNGQVLTDQLKKLRLTIDQLEMRLRQNSITHIEDVKWATLEPSGQLGYELKEHAKPATKGDIEQLMASIESKIKLVHVPPPAQPSQENLFTEVNRKEKDNPDQGELQ
ncbi:DUF421 domain-containing protein [Melghirimyces algeriensis]|uniref:YetF C-terminal domain-containing protein n=1 Tax=Melghirimyces algeriensis TaxID=910412 RepID=A0A521EZ85_9BACL|nr:DUF421 domain-containing protein [Melghirimyces algeriensis]SMO89173.1 Protein of unknown function [Melghirimyces algeriensis]